MGYRLRLFEKARDLFKAFRVWGFQNHRGHVLMFTNATFVPRFSSDLQFPKILHGADHKTSEGLPCAVSWNHPNIGQNTFCFLVKFGCRGRHHLWKNAVSRAQQPKHSLQNSRVRSTEGSRRRSAGLLMLLLVACRLSSKIPILNLSPS